MGVGGVVMGADVEVGGLEWILGYILHWSALGLFVFSLAHGSGEARMGAVWTRFKRTIP